MIRFGCNRYGRLYGYFRSFCQPGFRLSRWRSINRSLIQHPVQIFFGRRVGLQNRSRIPISYGRHRNRFFAVEIQPSIVRSSINFRYWGRCRLEGGRLIGLLQPTPVISFRLLGNRFSIGRATQLLLLLQMRQVQSQILLAYRCRLRLNRSYRCRNLSGWCCRSGRRSREPIGRIGNTFKVEIVIIRRRLFLIRRSSNFATAIQQ